MTAIGIQKNAGNKILKFLPSRSDIQGQRSKLWRTISPLYWLYWVIIFTWLVDLGKVNMPYPCQGHRVKVKVTGVKKNFKVKNFFFNFLCILDIFKQKKFSLPKPKIWTWKLYLEKFWKIFGKFFFCLKMLVIV